MNDTKFGLAVVTNKLAAKFLRFHLISIYDHVKSKMYEEKITSLPRSKARIVFVFEELKVQSTLYMRSYKSNSESTVV